MHMCNLFVYIQRKGRGFLDDRLYYTTGIVTTGYDKYTHFNHVISFTVIISYPPPPAHTPSPQLPPSLPTCTANPMQSCNNVATCPPLPPQKNPSLVDMFKPRHTRELSELCMARLFMKVLINKIHQIHDHTLL